MLQLYFSPGACSFVPHVGLEAAGAEFEPKLVKLHRGEHRTPEYLALNPNAQVPVLVVDGKPLTQIVAISDFLDRRFPQAALLPADAWERTQALSRLAWMNSTPHTTMTRFFFPERYAESESARQEVRQRAAQDFRGHLARLQEALPEKTYPLHDAYAFTLLRWGGFAGIDPGTLPSLRRQVEKAAQSAAFKAALARERIALDTFKG
ncbi:MAG: glutathione S-transferase family protein [Burkholderiales bacterium]